MDWLCKEQRIQICTLLDKGLYSPSKLTKQYDVHASTITRLYKKYQEKNTVKDLPKAERPHLIGERGERQLIRYLKNGECTTATQVQKKLNINYNIKKNCLKSAIKVKKPFLSQCHKKARLEFAKKHKNWKLEE